jgi:hypothetical protein
MEMAVGWISRRVAGGREDDQRRVGGVRRTQFRLLSKSETSRSGPIVHHAPFQSFQLLGHGGNDSMDVWLYMRL